MRYSVLIHYDREVQAYSAAVPELDIATQGDTVDEALDRVRSLIVFHLEGLARHTYEIPIEEDPYTIFPVEVDIPLFATSS
jgi:predicted RNase H-like HicB family nuclease